MIASAATIQSADARARNRISAAIAGSAPAQMSFSCVKKKAGDSIAVDRGLALEQIDAANAAT